MLRSDPASAFLKPLPARASAEQVEQRLSPLRFSALRTRCGEARCADAAACFSQRVIHRVKAAANRRCIRKISDVSDHSPGDGSAHPKLVTLARDPSHQAPPLHSSAARGRSCIAAYLHAMFRYRLGPSRPGRNGLILPSSRFVGAHGVLFLRRLAPVAGG